jgi:hypothetical protein
VRDGELVAMPIEPIQRDALAIGQALMRSQTQSG